jgi:hypothetical protein
VGHGSVDRSRPRPRLMRRVASPGNEMLAAIGTGLFVYLDALLDQHRSKTYPAPLEDEDENDMLQRPLLDPS